MKNRNAEIELDQAVNELSALANEQNRVANERARLKEKAHNIRGEKRNITTSFVRQAMDKFIEAMKHEGDKSRYIRGRFSDTFTKHVNRHGWFNSISNKHGEAIDQYNKALRNLNEVFVDELLTKEDARARLLNMAGIKNIHRN